MSDVATSGHLSIGEVLSLVQEDFPDVTISKIRFLESQGLIAPERTASGYRKFYDTDIDRLRWILGQQRDHVLPLKVIKKMLDQGVDVADASQVQPSLFSSTNADDADSEGSEPHQRVSGEPSTPRSPSHPAVASAPARVRREVSDPEVIADATDEPDPPPPAMSSPPAPSPEPVVQTEGSDADPPGDGRRTHATPADVVAALQEHPRSSRGARSSAGDETADSTPRSTARSSDPLRTTAPVGSAESVTAEELCAEVGISEELLGGLETFGLVVPSMLGTTPTYDPECVMVAKVAARYAEMGVEPRHLRMYKVAAEREAGFVEQLVMPLLKQRNPASRGQAVERTTELLEMGAELHAVLLRRQLGPTLGS